MLTSCPVRTGFDEPPRRRATGADGKQTDGGDEPFPGDTTLPGTDGAPSDGETSGVDGGDQLPTGDNVDPGDLQPVGDGQFLGDGLSLACGSAGGDPLMNGGLCPRGYWCDGGSCSACNTAQHCGQECSDCAGGLTNWDCISGQCGCDGSEDCRPGMLCELFANRCLPQLGGDSGPFIPGDGACSGRCSIADFECADCGGGATACNTSLNCCATCLTCNCAF